MIIEKPWFVSVKIKERSVCRVNREISYRVDMPYSVEGWVGKVKAKRIRTHFSSLSPIGHLSFIGGTHRFLRNPFIRFFFFLFFCLSTIKNFKKSIYHCFVKIIMSGEHYSLSFFSNNKYIHTTNN